MPVRAMDCADVRKNRLTLYRGRLALRSVLSLASGPILSKSLGRLLLIFDSFKDVLTSARAALEQSLAFFSRRISFSSFPDAPFSARKEAGDRSSNSRVSAVHNCDAANPFACHSIAVLSCVEDTNARFEGEPHPNLANASITATQSESLCSSSRLKLSIAALHPTQAAGKSVSVSLAVFHKKAIFSDKSESQSLRSEWAKERCAVGYFPPF